MSPRHHLLARSLSYTHFSHGGRSVETTQPLRAHERRVPLVDTKTHQHGKAGKQNCDAVPPTRTAACHLVLPCETGVVHARCCARHRARCTHGIRTVRGTRTRPLSARLLPLQRRVAVTCHQLHYWAANWGRRHRTWDKRARRARVGADTIHACHTYCIDHCCFLAHLLLLLASSAHRIWGLPKTLPSRCLIQTPGLTSSTPSVQCVCVCAYTHTHTHIHSHPR